MSDSNGRIQTRPKSEYRKWRELVEWLESKGFDGFGLKVEPRSREGAERGLFMTIRVKTPNTRILSIPAAALLNARTLRNIYPTIPLEGYCPAAGGFLMNATQLISLHLAVHRPKTESTDPHFGPYINMCPSDFESHPLTWIVRERMNRSSPHERQLLTMLPPHVFDQLCGVSDRFRKDWMAALQCLRAYGSQFVVGSLDLDIEDFLWGWLVVNTRCLFYRIFNGNYPLSNLTLCPIIEFANHTESQKVPRLEVEVQSENFFDRDGIAIETSDDMTFLSPQDRLLERDEEVFLKYGNHSKSLLFTEYGFVDDSAEPELDITWLVKELAKRKPSADVIMKVMADLPEHFQSKMQLFVAPEPPAPSWNTLCTLRLFNLTFPLGAGEEMLGVEEVMKPWYDVSLGIRDSISEENEMAVRQDLRWIIKTLTRKATDAKKALKDLRSEAKGGPEWYEWSIGCIEKLWDEQHHVASAVHLSLAANVQF